MRRAHLKVLPQLMKFYPGLKPWDLDRMTFRELDELVVQMDRYLQQEG